MRLWPRKRDAEREPVVDDTPAPDEEARTVTPSPETLRALRAAEHADQEYDAARRLRGRIDRAADQIDDQTRQNGFRTIIARALRSGT